jgi:hypothetical protein
MASEKVVKHFAPTEEKDELGPRLVATYPDQHDHHARTGATFPS